MPTDGTPMIGREAEQERLASFVAAHGGRCLVLHGDSGAGKSALLDFGVSAAEAAGTARVIRAAGVEAEAGIPYAGLHQLLYPLRDDVAQLDPAARRLFDAVFGVAGAGACGPADADPDAEADSEPPSVMALGIAVLNLLTRAGARRPLLLVLDDAQWLDDASARICGFVGRRLTPSRVKLLVATRSDTASRFDTAALPELRVDALSDEDAHRLVSRRFPGLGSHLRRLVLAEARGNPLALVELPAHLAARSGDQAPEGLPDPSDPSDRFGQHGVPLPHRLQRLYGTRIARLGDAVRAELLLGALDGAGTRPGRADAVPGPRYRMRDADEAVEAGLLDVDPLTGEFTFRHPLIRTGVVQSATPNERRAAHRELAHLHRDHLARYATHLAAATVDPDEEVAAVLEAAAASATRRGGSLAAVSWLTRAAELSEDQGRRRRRLTDAAFVAGYAGRLDRAHRLLPAAPAAGAPETPAAVLAAASQALYQDGDVRTGRHRVAAALATLRDSGVAEPDDVFRRLETLLLALGLFAGGQAAWDEVNELLDSLGDLVGERSRLFWNTWSDVVRHGAGWAEPVRDAAVLLPTLEPWDVTRLAASAHHLDLLGLYRPHLQRIVDRELETGAAFCGVVMLRLILIDQIAAGEWDAAERTGQRALDQALEQGLELFAYQTRGFLAQLAALRGQTGRARLLQAEVDAWARPRGLGYLTQLADSAGLLAALSDGDYEAAYQYAAGITAPGSFRPYTHQAPRTLLDLVEAARHTGRAAEARRHALAARTADLPELSPRLALLTYGALAMTAEDEAEAAEMFALAEGHPDAARFPFELARIRLAHGARVRRAAGRTAAGPLLAAAAEAFERLGAAGWAERAHAELRAAGAVRRTGADVLTWQERLVADLAASGLTNKEIGAQMHLSARTVSSHLYRVFPKLGITTRSALRDALRRVEDAAV